MSPRDTRIVVTGAMFVLFLSALEQTIVATALPAVMADLGRVDLGSWVVTAYLLSSVCATPVFGKLSDMYGRARVVRTCLVLFVLGSAWCAMAPGMPSLITARALQGLGGGGLMAMAQVIVADAVSPRERGRYAGYFSVAWMTAALLGPVLGGLLAEHSGWRWIFWLNLPLGALAWVLSTRSLRRLPVLRRKAHVDYVGIVLLTAASSALLAAVSMVRDVLAGNVVAVVVAIGAALATAAFVVAQQRAREPIIPPRFLRDPVIAPVLGAGFLVFGAYLALSVVLPLYFQIALGRSAAQSGLLLVPTMLTSSVSALLAGRYTRTHGRYRRPPLFTLPFAIVAMVLLGWLALRGSAPAVAMLAAIVALGIGTIFPCCVVAAQGAAAPGDMGAVSGAIGLSRALGGALVTGLAVAVLLMLVAQGLPPHAPLTGLDDLVRRPLDAATRPVVLTAFAKVIWGLAGVLAAGLVAFMMVEDRPLSEALPHARSG